jgi:hypothetical protein
MADAFYVPVTMSATPIRPMLMSMATKLPGLGMVDPVAGPFLEKIGRSCCDGRDHR